MRVLPRALLLLAGLHFLLLCVPSTAWAQGVQPVPYPNLPPPVPYGQPAPPAPPPTLAAVGQDVIHLKNGGILRGTIIDAIPDAQARIQLATGEIATVPWGEISRIEHAGAPPRPPPPPSSTPPQVQPSPPPPVRAPRSSALVWVHVEGGEGSRLEIDRESDGTWQTACRSPCDVALPVAADYRIAGGLLRQSGIFQLHGQQGDHVTVNVNGASKAWLVLGIVIVPIAGLVTLVAGLVALGESVAAAAEGSTCLSTSVGGGCASTSAQKNADSSAATAAWITAAVAAVVTLGGILLIANNSKTTVGVETNGPQGPPPEAWIRTPTWHEASAQDRAAPPVVGLPIFSGHF